jgi:hypothetical protein
MENCLIPLPRSFSTTRLLRQTFLPTICATPFLSGGYEKILLAVFPLTAAPATNP